MSLDDLRKKREKLKMDSDTTLENMRKIAQESNRVADVAHHSRLILDNLDAEFERQTGLKNTDITFLFTAVALHLARIFVINNMAKTEAPSLLDVKEKVLLDSKMHIINKIDNLDMLKADNNYYVPLNQIILSKNVPFEATDFYDLKEKSKRVNDPNKKVSVLGEEPILGLIFGTANILTDTVTSLRGSSIRTNHVVYDKETKNPLIGVAGSTPIMLEKAQSRIDGDLPSVVAATIKQLGHVAIDLNSKWGIKLPEENLNLSTAYAEQLTKYIGVEETIRVGISLEMIALLNIIIGTFHMLMYDPQKYSSSDIYSVKTRKIILYSNIIATSSNTIWVGANVAAGNETAIKELDIAGLIVILHRLRTDEEFIRKIKEEFIFGNFNKMIKGSDLALEEIE